MVPWNMDSCGGGFKSDCSYGYDGRTAVGCDSRVFGGSGCVCEACVCSDYTAVGLDFTAVGLGCTAVGLGCTAVGLDCTAVGLDCTAVGLGCTAVGVGCTAVGLDCATAGGICVVVDCVAAASDVDVAVPRSLGWTTGSDCKDFFAWRSILSRQSSIALSKINSIDTVRCGFSPEEESLMISTSEGSSTEGLSLEWKHLCCISLMRSWLHGKITWISNYRGMRNNLLGSELRK